MRALSHSGRPCEPGTPLDCCRKGRYSVGVPSGGGGTGLSSQRWRTSKVFVPSSSTFRLIFLRATALLSPSHFAPYGIARRRDRAVSPIAERGKSEIPHQERVPKPSYWNSMMRPDASRRKSTYHPLSPGWFGS